MKETEYWINIYKWYNSYINEYVIIQGKDKFISIDDAIKYFPSFGLSIAYRIHVRMK